MRRQPFPKPGEQLLDSVRGGLTIRYGPAPRSMRDEYRSLCDDLHLTAGGRIVLGGLSGLGLLAGLAGTCAAIYNVVSGTDPDIAGGAQLALTWIVVGCFEVLAVGALAALDGLFRAARAAVKRAV